MIAMFGILHSRHKLHYIKC